MPRSFGVDGACWGVQQTVQMKLGSVVLALAIGFGVIVAELTVVELLLFLVEGREVADVVP